LKYFQHLKFQTEPHNNFKPYFSALDNPETKDEWVRIRLHDRLVKSKNRRECDRTLTKLIVPITTECNIDLDEFLTQFLEEDTEDVSLECRVEIIKHFKTDDTKKKFLQTILGNLDYPWPAYLFEYATTLSAL